MGTVYKCAECRSNLLTKAAAGDTSYLRLVENHVVAICPECGMSNRLFDRDHSRCVRWNEGILGGIVNLPGFTCSAQATHVVADESMLEGGLQFLYLCDHHFQHGRSLRRFAARSLNTLVIIVIIALAVLAVLALLSLRE